MFSKKQQNNSDKIVILSEEDNYELARVFDERDNKTLLVGTPSEAMLLLSEISEDNPDFPHLWLEDIEINDPSIEREQLVDLIIRQGKRLERLQDEFIKLKYIKNNEQKDDK